MSCRRTLSILSHIARCIPHCGIFLVYCQAEKSPSFIVRQVGKLSAKQRRVWCIYFRAPGNGADHLRWGRGWRGLALGIVRVTLAAVSEMRPVYFVGDPPGLYHPWGIPLPPISARKYLVFQWYRHGLRCKRLIAMEFFADNRQQRT